MDDEMRAELARLHDEECRQNRRIEQLEENLKLIHDLTLSVHTLAHDMKQMLEEQKEQGERLDKLEQEPGNNWKHVKSTFITAMISAAAGGLVTGLIFVLSQAY